MLSSRHKNFQFFIPAFIQIRFKNLIVIFITNFEATVLKIDKELKFASGAVIKDGPCTIFKASQFPTFHPRFYTKWI